MPFASKPAHHPVFTTCGSCALPLTACKDSCQCLMLGRCLTKPVFANWMETTFEFSFSEQMVHLKGCPIAGSSTLKIASITMQHAQIVMGLCAGWCKPDSHLVHEHGSVWLLGLRIRHSQVVECISMLGIAGQRLLIQLNSLCHLTLQASTTS